MTEHATGAGAGSPEPDAALERAELADRLRTEANSLLANGLLALLAEHLGPVRVTGSVALDLMAVPDIDLYVLAESKDSEKFRRLLTELPTQLADQGCTLAKIGFSDEYVLPDPRFPTKPGLYLATTFVAPTGRTWTIDLWGWNASAHARRLREDRDLAEQMDSVDRDRVLRCKHLPGYGSDFSGVDVYDLVATTTAADDLPAGDRVSDHAALLAPRHE